MDWTLLAGGLVAVFLANALRRIPEDHLAVVKLLGRRLKAVRREGLTLLPFYPLLYSADIVNLRVRRAELPVRPVHTKDGYEVKVSASASWVPLADPEYTRDYFKNQDSIPQQLGSVLQDGLSTWLNSVGWREVHQERHRALPRMLPIVIGRSVIGDVDQMVADLRSSRAALPLPHLGIEIKQLNIELEDLGVVLGAILELESLMDRVRQLETSGADRAKVEEMYLVLRGKVQKRINESRYSVPAETLQELSGMLDFLNRRLAR